MITQPTCIDCNHGAGFGLPMVIVVNAELHCSTEKVDLIMDDGDIPHRTVVMIKKSLMFQGRAENIPESRTLISQTLFI